MFLLWIYLGLWRCLGAYADIFGSLEMDEGTIGDLYVNGVEVVQYPSLEILPLNSVAKHTISSTRIVPLKFVPPQVGEYVAMQLRHEPDNPIHMYDEDGLGLKPFNSTGGFILAFSDGTITNAMWSCTTSIPQGDAWKTDDTVEGVEWLPAEESSCCPWRNPTGAWNALAAMWIWAAEGDSVICRYKKTTVDVMDASPLPSADAAGVNIIGSEVMTSSVNLHISVTKDTDVLCVPIVATSQLRAPTAFEFSMSSVAAFRHIKVETSSWTDMVTLGNFDKLATQTPISSTVSTNSECRKLCEANRACGFISHTSSNTCYLYADEQITYESESGDLTVTHMLIAWSSSGFDTVQVGDNRLAPGTEFVIYCNSVGMSWELSKNSKVTVRTVGCPEGDCGSSAWPAMRIMGGSMGDGSAFMWVLLSKRGTLSCLAVKSTVTTLPTVEEVKTNGVSAYVNSPENPAWLEVPSNSAVFNVFCVAEDVVGNTSSDEALQESKRLFTNAGENILINLSDFAQQRQGEQVEISLNAQTSDIGVVSCMAILPAVSQGGVPLPAAIKAAGIRTLVPANTPTNVRILADVSDTMYEVYCMADKKDAEGKENVEQETSQASAFPVFKIALADAGYTTLRIVALLDREAELRCHAVQNTTLPTLGMLQNSSWHGELHALGGLLPLTIEKLMSGENYVLYCYTAQLSTALFRYEMAIEDILTTAYPFQTLGPSSRNFVAYCDVGQTCSLHIDGIGLSSADRILVNHSCRAACRCAGISDSKQKGAACSSISQHPAVVGTGPVPEPKAEDPKGSWCYVDPKDECPDAHRSIYDSRLWISYKVCEDELTREWADFPRNGLSTALDDGRTHSWGPERVNATAALYRLCWCGGLSGCTSGHDFMLDIGALIVVGPTILEKLRIHECMFGKPCVIGFDGFAISGGSLIMVSSTPALCFTVHDQGGRLFPNGGIAEASSFAWNTTEIGGIESASSITNFTFDPIVVPPGDYQICYCRFCNERVVGTTHLAAGGILHVSGPLMGQDFECYTNTMCSVEFVGLDMPEDMTVLAATECGRRDEAPYGWYDASLIKFAYWTGSGWRDTGVGTEELYSSIVVGAYGFSDGGRMNTSSTWQSPVMAMPGKYQLCWSAADSDNPSDFSPFATLTLRGPIVYPDVHLIFTCARLRTCKIEGLRGELSLGSRLLIVPWRTCGARNRLFHGFPNSGLSYPTLTGRTYEFGSELVLVPGGTYAMCWCPQSCGLDTALYTSFAGELKVISPAFNAFNVKLVVPDAETDAGALNIFYDVVPWAQEMAPSLPVNRHLKEMAPSLPKNRHLEDTFRNATWPESVRMIEQLSGGGYIIELQVHSFLEAEAISFAWTKAGRPVFESIFTSSVRWYCVRGEPCTISGVGGVGLSNENQILVALSCGESEVGVRGFPNQGRSLHTFNNGTVFSFGSKALTSASATYRLCWCPAECISERDFQVSLGLLVVGGPRSSHEYVCYQFKPCSFQLLGTMLHGGDRIAILPLDGYCSDYRIGVGPFPVSDIPFPQNGLSNKSNALFEVGFGLGMVGLANQTLKICWCSGKKHLCDEHGEPDQFAHHGGILRIATLKEYYDKYEAGFAHKDPHIEVWMLMTLPLPIGCFVILFYANRRRRHKIINKDLSEEETRTDLFTRTSILGVRNELVARRKEAKIGYVAETDIVDEDLTLPALDGSHAPSRLARKTKLLNLPGSVFGSEGSLEGPTDISRMRSTFRALDIPILRETT